MKYDFFKHPILNSPYACPNRHWELDKTGQPTNRLIETRRKSEYISPVPKPKKQRSILERTCLPRRNSKGAKEGSQSFTLQPFTSPTQRQTKILLDMFCPRYGIIQLTDKYIRPLAVGPLDYPERVPSPWGFRFFLHALACRSVGGAL